MCIRDRSKGLNIEANDLNTLSRLGNEADYLKNIDPVDLDYLSLSSGTEFNCANMSDKTKEAFKTFCSLLADDYRKEQKKLAAEMGLIELKV